MLPSCLGFVPWPLRPEPSSGPVSILRTFSECPVASTGCRASQRVVAVTFPSFPRHVWVHMEVPPETVTPRGSGTLLLVFSHQVSGLRHLIVPCVTG